MTATATPETAEAAEPDGPSGRELLVDRLAPAVLVLYFFLNFEPLALILFIPGLFTWTVFPAAVVGVLLITPTERISRIPISVALVAMTVWWVASYTWSEIPLMTRSLLASQVVPLLFLMLLVGSMRPRAVVKTLLGLVVVVGVWSLAISIVLPDARAATLGPGPEGMQQGFRGTFFHKNLLGMFMVYGLCLVLPFSRTRARPWLIALCIILVFSTRSATAGSGLMAVLFTWFWILAVDSQKDPRERQFMLVMSIVSVLVAIMLALGSMPALLGVYQKDFTFSGRTYIWEESMVSVARRPLQGYGLGGVWWDGRAPTTRDLHLRIGFGASHAHNGAIQMLLEVGLVGLGLFVVFVGRLVRLAVSAFGRPSTSPVGQWALLTVMSLLLMSISEPLFRGPDLGLLVVISTVLTVTWNGNRRSTTPRRPVTTL